MKAFDGANAVRSYFEGVGFERFRRLYGDEQCSRFQKVVRRGHAETLRTALAWLRADEGLRGISICDAGCGAGTLSIALAQRGARVHAVDFSRRMVGHAERRARELCVTDESLTFEVADLANVRGSFHTAICIDVFARYPLRQTVELLTRLTGLATSRLILSYTPKTVFDWPLLRLGNHYAKRRRLPALYTHRTESLVDAIEALGWRITRQNLIASHFNLYYCRLLELARDEPANGAPIPC
jgi:magnesium-protoporphyrin O-methyltransferase